MKLIYRVIIFSLTLTFILLMYFGGIPQNIRGYKRYVDFILHPLFLKVGGGSSLLAYEEGTLPISVLKE